MATFTLESLREAADRKYGPTVIETPEAEYKLPNILRMEAGRRSKVEKLLEQAEKFAGDESAAGIDKQIQLFEKLVVAAEENDRGQELVDEINDSAILIDVVTSWLEATQAGEAES